MLQRLTMMISMASRDTNTVCVYISTVRPCVRRRSAHSKPDSVKEIPAILHKNHLYLRAGRWHANGKVDGLGQT